MTGPNGNQPVMSGAEAGAESTHNSRARFEARTAALAQAILMYLLVLFLQDASFGGSLKDVPMLSVLPSITWSIVLPLSLPIVVSILLLAFMPRVERTMAEQRVRSRLVSLIWVYLGAVVIERLVPSSLDTRPSWTVYAFATSFPLWVLIGFRLAASERAVQKLSGQLGWWAAASAVLFTFAENMLGYDGLYGWNWWPVRLAMLFGFSVYVFRLLTKKGWGLTAACIGIASVSTQILVPFQKPVVWAALWTGSAVMILLAHNRGMRMRRVTAVAAALLIGAVFVYRSDVSDGGLVARYVGIVERDWLHLDARQTDPEMGEAIRLASGGRDVIWANAAPRFFSSPLIGTGLMQIDDEAAVHVHSYFIDLVLGVGLLGALPVFAVIGMWLAALMRTGTRARSASDAIPLAAYAVGVGAYGLVGNFTSFLLPGILAAICIGASLRLSAAADGAVAVSRRRPLAGRGL